MPVFETVKELKTYLDTLPEDLALLHEAIDDENGVNLNGLLVEVRNADKDPMVLLTGRWLTMSEDRYKTKPQEISFLCTKSWAEHLENVYQLYKNDQWRHVQRFQRLNMKVLGATLQFKSVNAGE